MGNATFTYQNKTKELEIQRSIPLTRAGQLVELVASVVYDGESGYAPYFYEAALYGNILDFYTDFGEEASNEEIYKMLCESDLIEVLERHISPIQMQSIRAAIDKKVEYKLQHALNQGEWSGLAADLRDFLAKYEKKFSRSFKPKILSQAMENLAKMEVSEQGLIDALTDKAQTQKKAENASAKKTEPLN